MARLLSLAFVLVALAALPSTASATIPAGNLVVNGGAEVGPSSEVGDRHPIPGWTTDAGPAGFMTVDYREPGDPSPRMHSDDPNTSGCRAFFGGGEGVTTKTSATQTIDVSAAAAEIDAEAVTVRTTAAAGQLAGGEDTTQTVFNFLNGSGGTLGANTFNTTTAATQLFVVATSGPVPKGTRTIRIELSTTPGGPSDTAYIDGVALTLDGSDPQAATVPSGCNGGAAITGLASGVTETSATLAGTVLPNLDFTRYRFEYGPTTAYGASSAPGETDGQPASLPVSSTLAGLRPGTLYHYRLVAESPRPLPLGGLYASPSLGMDGTFLTAGTPPAPSSGQLTRSLSLRYSARRNRFSGRISSSDPGCLRGTVKVFRTKKGRDPKVASAKARADGGWSAGEDAGRGRYYAEVGARSVGTGVCPAAKSRTIRVG